MSETQASDTNTGTASDATPKTPVTESLPEINTSANASAGDALGAGGIQNMDALFDISVNVSVVVGQKNMRLKEVMKLAKDSVVELDKLAGEPLDIIVNGSLIAHGEIVVANEKYGIRIVEIAAKPQHFEGLQK